MPYKKINSQPFDIQTTVSLLYISSNFVFDIDVLTVIQKTAQLFFIINLYKRSFKKNSNNL